MADEMASKALLEGPSKLTTSPGSENPDWDGVNVGVG